MTHYRKHVFVCENLREAGRPSCGAHSSVELCAHLKKRTLTSKRISPGSVRINRSGCLGQCPKGPALVVYPEGTWYTYSNESDIDEIFERDILEGERVTRLLLE